MEKKNKRDFIKKLASLSIVIDIQVNDKTHVSESLGISYLDSEETEIMVLFDVEPKFECESIDRDLQFLQAGFRIGNVAGIDQHFVNEDQVENIPFLPEIKIKLEKIMGMESDWDSILQEIVELSDLVEESKNKVFADTRVKVTKVAIITESDVKTGDSVIGLLKVSIAQGNMIVLHSVENASYKDFYSTVITNVQRTGYGDYVVNTCTSVYFLQILD